MSRTARYAILGDFGPATRELWLVLHGYGMLAARFLEWFRPAAAPGRVIVAPEGLSRFYLEEHKRVGASWMTREDRDAEIDDYVHYLDDLVEHLLKLVPADVRIHVHGFSQGTATASRWVIQGRPEVERLVLWGGDVATDINLREHAEKLHRAGLTLVCGTTDAFVSPNIFAAEVARLRAAALAPRVERFEGGHLVDGEVLRRLAAESSLPTASPKG